MASRFSILVALAIAVQSTGALAQEKLGWLSGKWAGNGMSMGKPSTSTFEAAPALGGAYVEFRYALAKPFPFEGRAFYREKKDGSWDASWFDSRGVAFPIASTLSGKVLTSNWGTPETEQGRTVYRLMDDGRLEIVDSVLRRDGQWREFARQIFKRTP